MKKLLYITTQLPYPPISGGVIKSWKMVEHFSKEYELSLFCFLKGRDKDWLKQFERRVNLKAFKIQEFEIRRSYKALINSYLRNKTLNLYRNFSKVAKAEIAEMAKGIDILVIDHYEMFQYVPKSFDGKVVLHQHNAEYVLWERFAEIESSVIKKNFLYLESKRIQRAEKAYCRRSDLILAAPNDIEKLSQLGINRNKFKETYHLGEDSLLNEKAQEFDKTEKVLMFLGTLSWEANVDGLLHFIRAIFPLILKQEPETKLYIVGKDADDRIKAASADYENILLTGFVDNVEPFYKKSRVFILPLRFGSGMKVKFLNALYRGIPVVSTPVGAEGIDVINEDHALVAETDVEFADSTLKLLSDKALWNDLQKNGRSLAVSKYQWSDHLSDLSRYLRELISTDQ